MPAATEPSSGISVAPVVASRREDFDRTALVVASADVSLPLQIAEVLVHGGEGLVAELFGDFLETWRVAVPVDGDGEIIEDFALLASERHARPPG